jgi:hypothetical protein
MHILVNLSQPHTVGLTVPPCAMCHARSSKAAHIPQPRQHHHTHSNQHIWD